MVFTTGGEKRRIRGQEIGPSEEARPTCYTCFRPTSHCVCGLVTPFTAHCGILILQHPNEWRKYYSTVKLVQRAVRNSACLRGVIFDENMLKKRLNSREVYLLYPGANAANCEEVLLNADSTVVVIDGTWDEAGKIVYRNPILKTLPRLSFAKKLCSNYRIRKEPKEGCLSTVEAVGHLLRLNALAQGKDAAAYDGLFEAFGRMVDQQLSFFPRMRDPAFGQAITS